MVARGGQVTLICKGAPEGLVALASACVAGGATVPLDDAARARCLEVFRAASADGFRVLAVATRALPPREAYSADDERDLMLAGFLTFADPPLADARDAIESLRNDGVDVKILTGDNELCARHVCGQVGLDVSDLVLGSDIDRMTDSALAHVAEQSTVFARVSPAQKNRIILALKQRSHVVGYLGDGINDAPSLHAADVGISVASAVDVARDAADIILLEPGLRVLHAGILAGRHAFGNVMKYLLMGTSSNFGNMLSMAGASLFLPFLPMLPTQILLNNFLYDLAQVTIPTDHVDAELGAPAAALGHPPHPQLHAVHRPGELGLRLPDVLRALAAVPRRPERCSTPAGSSSRWRRRRWSCSSSARRRARCAAGRAGRWR